MHTYMYGWMDGCNVVCMGTSRLPSWHTILPAAVVAAPERKLECWKRPFFFCPTYKALDVLRTKIHLETSSVFKGIPLALYISFPPFTITSNDSLSFCKINQHMSDRRVCSNLSLKFTPTYYQLRIKVKNMLSYVFLSFFFVIFVYLNY